MHFRLTDEQRRIRDLAAEFADREVAPGAAERDATDTYPRDLFEKLSEMDFMGLCVPGEYGGAGADFLSYVLALEELSRADAGVGVTLAVHTSAGTLPILLYGDEDQKRRWVPPLASGEKVGCFMLTEPGIGSDAGAMEATAERTTERGDGGYRLSGHKQWITNGRVAGTGIVFARVPEVGPTAFIVPMDAPGLSFGKHAKKMGVISATTDDVHLDGVFVPEKDVLGEPGKGLRVALGTLDPGRIGIAAQAVGIAEAAFRHAAAFAAERKTFGKAIGEHQAIAFKLAEMQVEVRAARLLTYEAAWLKDAGERVTEAGARAKLYASGVANRVAYEALQILGGRGYMRDEGPVERLYRDARVTEIYEGTSEIQKLVLSRAILKEHAASLEAPAGVEEERTVVG
ncbi:Acyl-CoA dehydrogenase [Rubrobacter radiotolerans]|uniref:Acyl-CoA dehydrogenase n=1 Tax=Rubrobacter radiotolerans TaxID=42256 RepID=A0A023X0W8_RUBRA|nr:acyl-CoA dehydrogenase family protein [Rubrobacter radiotolerans]AHY45709.1 Acyl-CoA dehydrogenase [Rubrobacter radiotolerans]MDX5893125.1 acyl-CoA dehydrogenase family protein [Rubrobacter radiotolerans]SMC03101.1 Acyl-CoA dehydrogenase, middle domain [Rubrobacter radiotolerans DSM 5868]